MYFSFRLAFAMSIVTVWLLVWLQTFHTKIKATPFYKILDQPLHIHIMHSHGATITSYATLHVCR